MSLTPKQERFCQEYLIDVNATQAAIRAGYSKRRADQTGYENLIKPEIQFTVQRLMKERARRTGIKADDVLQEVARIAYASMTDYATWGPDGIKLVGSERLTPEQTVAVAEVSETTTQHGGSKCIKLHDKLKALELLGRHLGLWDKNGQTEQTPDWVQTLEFLVLSGWKPKNPNLNITLESLERCKRH